MYRMKENSLPIAFEHTLSDIVGVQPGNNTEGSVFHFFSTENGSADMDIFDKIKQEIMADPMNEFYTKKGISPLFKASENARIVIVGQAPGRKAEKTRLYWNDLSGDRLREWMGISRDEFYETDRIAHLPMDFYYPGKADHGDLPPRKGFAEKWHPLLLKRMPNIETIILVGTHAKNIILVIKGKKI